MNTEARLAFLVATTFPVVLSVLALTGVTGHHSSPSKPHVVHYEDGSATDGTAEWCSNPLFGCTP